MRIGLGLGEYKSQGQARKGLFWLITLALVGCIPSQTPVATSSSNASLTAPNDNETRTGLLVEVMLDGVKTVGGGTLFINKMAYQIRYHNIRPNYGFDLIIPNELATSKPHTIYLPSVRGSNYLTFEFYYYVWVGSDTEKTDVLCRANSTGYLTIGSWKPLKGQLVFKCETRYKDLVDINISFYQRSPP
ncbi:hypothetical protein ANRL4_02459 [Anaerolineae bacterium]|nr:hypothetical protein ANRL4_02459 [Anaerolineae bacterium]